MVRFTILALAVSACGSDAAKPDASVDAKPTSVVMVTCPATPAGTIMTNDMTDAYMPMSVMINQGQVVKFVTSVTHNVVPDPTSDPGLKVDFSSPGTCLMFTQTGTFGFHCSIHLFEGSVVVQ